MPTGRQWQLVRFTDAFRDLGDLPDQAREAFAQWLTRVAAAPFSVHDTQLNPGRHLGETLLGDEKEDPFPPYFTAMIFTSDGRAALSCQYIVDPDTRTVTCVKLQYLWG